MTRPNRRASVRAACVLALLGLALPSCTRWVPYETVDIRTSESVTTETLLHLAEYASELGYAVDGDEIPEGAFRVRHKTLRGDSYYVVAIAEDGTLIVLPEGGLVREGGNSIHVKFLARARAFAAELEQVLE